MMKITPDQLSDAIQKNLEIYSESIVDGISEVGERVAEKAVQLLKASSPKRFGKYAKSWTFTAEHFRAWMPKQFIIHARKPYYRLTHLLEKGHAKRDGGRVKAQPHIIDAESMVIDEYVKGVEEVIKRGG